MEELLKKNATWVHVLEEGFVGQVHDAGQRVCGFLGSKHHLLSCRLIRIHCLEPDYSSR